MLGRARTQLHSAGEESAAVVARAQEQAPQQPSLFDQAVDAVEGAVEDAGTWAAQAGEDLVGDVVRAGGDVVDDLGVGVGKFAGDVTRAVGDATGGLLKDIGEATGLDAVSSAGQTVAQSVDAAGDTAEDFLVGEAAYARNETYNAAHDIDGRSPAVRVYVDEDEFPEAAQHIDEAQDGTSWRGHEQVDKQQPSEVTLDREHALQHRREALRGVPTQPGSDRDEYPLAMFDEGGAGASVKYINPHDNRGAGATINAQTRGLEDGHKVVINTY